MKEIECLRGIVFTVKLALGWGGADISKTEYGK